MSDRPVLSSSDQENFLSQVASRERLNDEKAKKNGRWAAGTLIAAAALFAVCPLAGLLGILPIVAATACAVFVGNLAGNALTRHSLGEMKKNAGKEGFVDRLKARAKGLHKFTKGASRLSDIALWATAAAIVVSWIAPPLAIIPLVINAGFLVMGPAALTSMSLRDSDEAIGALSTIARRQPSVSGPQRAAAPAGPAPAALANAPSPKSDFTGAANTNASQPAAPANTNEVATPKQPAIKP